MVTRGVRSLDLLVVVHFDLQDQRVCDGSANIVSSDETFLCEEVLMERFFLQVVEFCSLDAP